MKISKPEKFGLMSLISIIFLCYSSFMLNFLQAAWDNSLVKLHWCPCFRISEVKEWQDKCAPCVHLCIGCCITLSPIYHNISCAYDICMLIWMTETGNVGNCLWKTDWSYVRLSTFVFVLFLQAWLCVLCFWNKRRKMGLFILLCLLKSLPPKIIKLKMIIAQVVSY